MVDAVKFESMPSNPNETFTPLEFTGKASEYFGIWITNILLSIVTIGIYSAWAKVRTKKYFAHHTLIAGTGFDYHAKPLNILKGRIIAVVLYSIYGFVSQASPLLAVIFLGLVFLATPWIILQSMRFNLRNTSHRGLRFNFVGKLGEAVKIYIFYTALIVFTLGLILPFLNYRSRSFAINNTCFGLSRFQAKLTARSFYLTYLKLGGWMILVAIGCAALLGLAHTVGLGFNLSALISFLPLLLLIIVIVGPGAYLKASLGKLVYNSTHLENFSFKCDWRARDLIWIYASNFILIVLSFGLLIPWSKIRSTQYLVSRMAIKGDTNFDQFVAGKIDQLAATGQEIGEFFDVDLPVLG
ncbi:MAG: hypothetical protein RI984_1165 [Pseudomonadota bacterium]|jgi:uncharacterized membrane protein YjgN (DUF898 family)